MTLIQKTFKNHYARKSGYFKDRDGTLYSDVLFVGIDGNDYIYLDSELNICRIDCMKIKSFNYHTVTGRQCGPWEDENDFRTDE